MNNDIVNDSETAKKSVEMLRVIAYIDGFNLYFGMKSMGYRRYYWLDLPQLIGRLLKPNQCLVEVKYFTARITSPENKRIRQNTYLEAVATLPAVQIIEGNYIEKPVRCRLCSKDFLHPEEKMTDSNIATGMLVDAMLDKFDVALLVSGDSDHVPALRAIRLHWPRKQVVVAFPPNRYSTALAKSAATFRISRAKFAASQLPDQVRRADGYVLNRPQEWQETFSLSRGNDEPVNVPS